MDATVEMFIETLWTSDSTHVLFIVQEGTADAETETEYPHTAWTTSRKRENKSWYGHIVASNIDQCES
jgi:hypothetical protein